MRYLQILLPLLLGAPKENPSMWSEYSMEAFSQLGEFLYEQKSYKQAREVFHESLQTSTKILEPTPGWVSLDLYRVAQLDAQRGRLPEARKNLELLIHRYPESPWTEPARRLLEMILKAQGVEGDQRIPSQNLPLEDESFLMLQSLWSAVLENRTREAIEFAQEFLKKYPQHPASPEVGMLEALLHWKLEEMDAAQALLTRIFEQAKEGPFKNKARYLLAAFHAGREDYGSVEFLVPSLSPNTDLSSMDRWLLLAQFWKALSYLKRGEFAPAKAHSQMSLKAQPESPLQAYAKEILGISYDREGDLTQALNHTRQAYEEAKRWGLSDLEASALLSLGHLFYKQSRWDLAQKSYEKFLTLQGKSSQIPLALYQLGLTYKKLQRREEAVRTLERLVQAYPEEGLAPHAYLQLGQIHWLAGNVGEAISSYQKMRQAGSSNPEWEREAILLIAQCRYNTKQFAQAIPLYKEFLQKSPQDERASQVQTLLLTSSFLWDKGDPELEAYLSEYSSQPIAAYIRWELGAGAYKRKDFISAKRHFERVWTDFPKTSYAPGALYYFGECLVQEKNYPAAAATYRLMLERHPEHTLAKQTRFRLAAALYEAKRYEESAEYFQEFLKKSPKDALTADALFNQAIALAQSQKKSLALKSYEELLKRFPQYPQRTWAWLQVGSLRESLGQWKKAVEAYSRIPFHQSERLQAQLAIGRCHEKLKETAQAQKAYEALAKLRPKEDPSRLTGLTRLALLYELQNQQKKAAHIYLEVSGYALESSLAQLVQQRMEFIQKRQMEILSAN